MECKRVKQPKQTQTIEKEIQKGKSGHCFPAGNQMLQTKVGSNRYMPVKENGAHGG